jgi:ribokinase
MNGRVCVLGSFMTDLIVNAPRRPAPGETLVGTLFGIHLGGKGFNQAVAAARMGATTAMVGRLGDDDFGDRFRAALDAEGIDRRQVGCDATQGTGVGLPVVEPDGQNSIIIVPQANGAVTTGDVTAAAAQVRDADVLLLQLELPVATALEAARIAAANGTTVILNPAPWQPVPADLLALADVLVPNEVEAAQLLGPDGFDARGAADRIHRQLRTTAVVTLGRQGVAVAAEGVTATVAAHDVPAVDTVGAGDTFCGALAAELAAGADLLQAVELANAAAAIAVTRPGGADSAPGRDAAVALVDSLRGVAPA